MHEVLQNVITIELSLESCLSTINCVNFVSQVVFLFFEKRLSSFKIKLILFLDPSITNLNREEIDDEIDLILKVNA